MSRYSRTQNSCLTPILLYDLYTSSRLSLQESTPYIWETFDNNRDLSLRIPSLLLQAYTTHNCGSQPRKHPRWMQHTPKSGIKSQNLKKDNEKSNIRESGWLVAVLYPSLFFQSGNFCPQELSFFYTSQAEPGADLRPISVVHKK